MTTLDPASGTNKVASMVRSFFKNALRSSIGEIVSKPLQEINLSLERLESRIDAVDLKLTGRLDDTIKQMGILGARLDSRIDEMGTRIDEMGTRMDVIGTRIDETGSRLDNFANRFGDKFDELSAQQGRIIEEVAGLKGEVAGLKTDQKLVDTLEHRVARIEDRLFSKAV